MLAVPMQGCAHGLKSHACNKSLRRRSTLNNGFPHGLISAISHESSPLKRPLCGGSLGVCGGIQPRAQLTWMKARSRSCVAGIGLPGTSRPSTHGCETSSAAERRFAGSGCKSDVTCGRPRGARDSCEAGLHVSNGCMASSAYTAGGYAHRPRLACTEGRQDGARLG